jgi:hypothetical protein
MSWGLSSWRPCATWVTTSSFPNGHLGSIERYLNESRIGLDHCFVLFESKDVTVEGISCLMCSGTSPLVRRYYLSCTSAVYSPFSIPTVRSYTQYNLSSILQFFCICAVSKHATKDQYSTICESHDTSKTTCGTDWLGVSDSACTTSQSF